ncbi:MAG: response regulator [Desulforhopalus sp.]
MTYFLLVSSDKIALELLSKALLQDEQNRIHHAFTGQGAMDLLGSEQIDVVIAAEELSDGDGLTFIKKLTQKYPLVNCSMVSSLPTEEFHEETEGLGVFMQLPQNPGVEEAEQMMHLLESINALMAS